MRLGSPTFVKHCLMWYRGKHRRQPKITLKDLMSLRFDLQREEQNMLLLRHPYLTAAQSHGHMTDLRKHEEKVNVARQRQEWKFEKYVTLEDRLHHLKHREAWD